MKRAYPNKNKPLPTGVKNIKGKVITNPEEKKFIALNHFKQRMISRPVVEEVKDIVQLGNELFDKRLDEAKTIESETFDMNELDKILKSLKTGKRKDPNNYINELFKEGDSS